MEQSEFFTTHGKRFCFFLIWNIVSFVPIAWLKWTDNDAQRYWVIIFELQLVTGVLLPLIIEGCFMRKGVQTYRDTNRSIRSFYLAPVFGLLLTFLVPHLYFWYVVIGPSPGLFASD